MNRRLSEIHSRSGCVRAGTNFCLQPRIETDSSVIHPKSGQSSKLYLCLNELGSGIQSNAGKDVEKGVPQLVCHGTGSLITVIASSVR